MKYSSTARISVDKSDSKSTNGYDPYWLQTQFETIQSVPVLQLAINKMNLRRRWELREGDNDEVNLSFEQTMQRLRPMLTVKQYRSTTLIDIIIQSSEQDEAAEIANTIAESYQSVMRDKNVTVEVIKVATAGKRPISTSIFMILICEGIGFSLLVGGLIYWISGEKPWLK